MFHSMTTPPKSNTATWGREESMDGGVYDRRAPGSIRFTRTRSDVGRVGTLSRMHRAARVGTWVGGAVVVLALSKVHARYVVDPSYDFTGSSRLAWALGYVLLLGLAAYTVGLPDAPRTLRDAASRSVAMFSASSLGSTVPD